MTKNATERCRELCEQLHGILVDKGLVLEESCLVQLHSLQKLILSRPLPTQQKLADASVSSQLRASKRPRLEENISSRVCDIVHYNDRDRIITQRADADGVRIAVPNTIDSTGLEPPPSKSLALSKYLRYLRDKRDEIAGFLAENSYKALFEEECKKSSSITLGWISRLTEDARRSKALTAVSCVAAAIECDAFKRARSGNYSDRPQMKKFVQILLAKSDPNGTIKAASLTLAVRRGFFLQKLGERSPSAAYIASQTPYLKSSADDYDTIVDSIREVFQDVPMTGASLLDFYDAVDLARRDLRVHLLGAEIANAILQPIAFIIPTVNKACFLTRRLLERGVPARAIEQAVLPQERWSESGERYEITLAKNVAAESPIRCLVNKHVTEVALCYATARWDPNVFPMYDTASDAQRIPGLTADVEREVLTIVLFALPRNALMAAINTELSEYISSLLPVLQSVLREIEPTSISQEIMDDIVQVYLSNPVLKTLFSSPEALLQVRTFTNSQTPRYLQLLCVLQHSIYLRGQGLFRESHELLFSCKILSATATDSVYTLYLRGRLHLSQAENYIHAEDFNASMTLLEQCSLILQEFRTFDLSHVEHQNSGPTILKLHVHLLRMWTSACGRVYRYQGRFSESVVSLKKALEDPNNKKPANLSQKCHILHHLVDVQCELKSSIEMRPELEQTVAALGQMGMGASPSYRRLKTCLAEVHLLNGDTTEAVNTFSALIATFNNMQATNPADQIGHVQVLLKRALLELRRSGWRNDIHCQRTIRDYALIAKRLIQEYDTFLTDGFYSKFTEALLNLVENAGDASRKMPDLPPPRFFIVGIGTYDLTLIEQQYLN